MGGENDFRNEKTLPSPDGPNPLFLRSRFVSKCPIWRVAYYAAGEPIYGDVKTNRLARVGENRRADDVYFVLFRFDASDKYF